MVPREAVDREVEAVPPGREGDHQALRAVRPMRGLEGGVLSAVPELRGWRGAGIPAALGAEQEALRSALPRRSRDEEQGVREHQPLQRPLAATRPDPELGRPQVAAERRFVRPHVSPAA